MRNFYCIIANVLLKPYRHGQWTVTAMNMHTHIQNMSKIYIFILLTYSTNTDSLTTQYAFMNYDRKTLKIDLKIF